MRITFLQNHEIEKFPPHHHGLVLGNGVVEFPNSHMLLLRRHDWVLLNKGDIFTTQNAIVTPLRISVHVNLKFIGPCIILIVE